MKILLQIAAISALSLCSMVNATTLSVINNHISDGVPGERTIVITNKHCFGKHLGLNYVCRVYPLSGRQFHQVNNLPEEGRYIIYLYYGEGVSKTGPFARCTAAPGETISVFGDRCR